MHNPKEHDAAADDARARTLARVSMTASDFDSALPAKSPLRLDNAILQDVARLLEKSGGN